MRSQSLAPTLKVTIFCALLAVIACGPARDLSLEVTGAGTLTVDADISKGTRFRVYCNDVWAAPELQQVIAGRRTKYIFPLPASLRSLRLDPSEMDGSRAIIYAIDLELPGMPRKSLPLTDLTQFAKYHCDIKPQINSVEVDASGIDMYFMGTVNPASYPAAQ